MTEEAGQQFMAKAEPQEERRWPQRLAREWSFEG